jgi:hypothetical protein
MTARIREQEQNKKERTASKGHPVLSRQTRTARQSCLDRTAGTRLPEQGCHDRTARIRRPGQDGNFRTGQTKLADRQNRIDRTGLQNRTDRKRLPG